MPFAFDLLDEQQKKAQQQQQGEGAPAMTGGGLSFGAGSPQAQPQQEKGTQKQGSGFVGLDQYMNANKGNKFGNQFTGKVQGSLDSAKQSLDQGAQGFTNASNQGSTKWNDVQGQVKGIVDNAGDGTTKDDAAKIQGYQTAKYQGPESFLGTSFGTQAQGSVQKASQQANALQSEGGRFALLDQYFGRPKYNMGEKSLDNLLVQNTPGVAARAQNIGEQAKQFSTTASQKYRDMDNYAAANKQATADAAQQTVNYLNQAKTDFDTGLNSRYNDYKTSTQAYNDARRNDLSDDALDADTMSLLGLKEGDSLYNTNLSSYLKDSPMASLGQFASDKDYAKYLALSQLAEEDPTLLSADQRKDAGTAEGKGRVSFDKNRFLTDRQNAKSAYTSQYSALQTQAADLSKRAADLRAAAEQSNPYEDTGNPLVKKLKPGRSPDDDAYNFAMDLLRQASQLDQSATGAQSQMAELDNIYQVNRKVRKA